MRSTLDQVSLYSTQFESDIDIIKESCAKHLNMPMQIQQRPI